MEILSGNMMVQNTAHLIAPHWDNLIFVPKVSRLIGVDFDIGDESRKATPPPPPTPMIFNIVMDVVVKAVLDIGSIPQELWHG